MSHFPFTQKIAGMTFTRNERGGAPLLWGDLHSMSDAQVKSAIKARLPLGTDDSALQKIAAFATINPSTQTYDYPEQDRERAALGHIVAGNIAVYIG